MSGYNVAVTKFSRSAKVLDVLKIIPLTDKKRCEHAGNVSFHLDSVIYKNVCQILGRIAASNKVVLPRRPTSKTPSKDEVRSLRLSERYLYAQVCKVKGRHCTLHFDLTTHRQVTINVSLSTIYKEVKVSNHGVNIPLPITDKWTILCLDFVEILERYFPKEVLRYLKRISLCSNMLVCGIFASDTRFNHGDVPKKIAFLRRNGKRWEDMYSWINIPELVGTALVEESAALRDAVSGSANGPFGTPKRDFKMVVSRVGAHPTAGLLRTPHSVRGASTAMTVHSAANTSVVDKVLRGSNYSSSHISHAFQARTGSPTKKVKTNLEVPPMMTLDRVTAVTPCSAAGAWWYDHNRTVVFPSGNLVVLQSIGASAHSDAAQPSAEPGQQSFLIGHTSPVIGLCVGDARHLIVSADNGPVPSIRVWNARSRSCLAVILGPSSGVTSVQLSDDETLLCVTGTDDQNRHQVFVWDISNVDGSVTAESQTKVGSPARWAATKASLATQEAPYTLAAKQMSEFPIRRMKFLPGSNAALISCGPENIRFWRIRERHLRGRPVVLQSHLRKLDFLDFSFEKSKAANLTPQRHSPRVFVASNEGQVVIVDPRTSSVETSFKVHDSAITALSVNEGYCVTASDDRSIKVWPLDFSDFFLQAPHDGQAARVSVSNNGLQVLVDSELGTLGVLHIASQRFVSVMRSHSAEIHAVAHSWNKSELATTSSDHTIRVWELGTMSQLYEFTLSGYQCRCLEFEPTGRNHLICGFDSGHVRVLDVASTSLVKEMKESNAPIACVACLPNGSRFFSLDTDGVLCTYKCTDASSSAAEVGGGYHFAQKTTVFPQPSLRAHVRNPNDMSLAVSSNSRVVACASSDSQKVLLLWADSLDVLSYLSCPANFSVGAGFTSIMFDPHATQITAASSSRALVTWSIADSSIIRHLPAAHHQRCTAAAAGADADSAASQFFVTGDSAGLLSLWTQKTNAAAAPLLQHFTGHNTKISSLTSIKSVQERRFVISVAGTQIFKWAVDERALDTRDHSHQVGQAALEDALEAAGVDQQASSAVSSPAALQNFRETEVVEEDADAYDESEYDTWEDAEATKQQGQSTADHASTLPAEPEGQFLDIVTSIDVHESSAASEDTLDLSRAAPKTSSKVHFERKSVIGYSGEKMNRNLLWNQSSGIIVSSCGSVLVVEDLSTNAQYLHDVSADKPSAVAVPAGDRRSAPSNPVRIRGVAANRDASLIAVEAVPNTSNGSAPFTHTWLNVYRFSQDAAASDGNFELLWSSSCSCVGAPLINLQFSQSSAYLLYALGGCGIFVKGVNSGSTIGTVFLAPDSDAGDGEPAERLLTTWLTPTTFVRVRTNYLRLQAGCFAELWDVGGSNALQLTKRPYRVQLDLSLRTPGVAYASAIDTCVTFEGEDHLVVCTSDGVINQFTNVSFVQCEGAEGDVGQGFVHALQSSVASVVAIKPSKTTSVLAPLLGGYIDSQLVSTRRKTQVISNVRWCRNGSYIVSAGRSIFLVNYGLDGSGTEATGTPSRSPTFKQIDLDAEVVSFSFGVDADKGVAGTVLGTLWFIEWSAGSLVRLTSSHAAGIRSLQSIPATPNRPGLICSAGGADGSLRIWAASRPSPSDDSSSLSLQQLIQFEVPRASCTAVSICEVDLAAPGSTGPQPVVYAAAGYSDGTVRVFNVTNIKVVQKFTLPTGQAEISAIAIVRVDGEDSDSASSKSYAVVCGTNLGHIVATRIETAGGADADVSRDATSAQQNILVRGDVASGRHGSGSVACIETSNHDTARWLACNEAGHLTIWSGEDIAFHVPLDAVVAEARKTHQSRPSSFGSWQSPVVNLVDVAVADAGMFCFLHVGQDVAVFSPVDSDVVLISARSVPPLILAYHLQKKCVIFSMPLTGWPRALDFFVAPNYPANFIALVSTPGPKQRRLLSLLDLRSGREIVSARQFVQDETLADASAGGLNVVFGCESSSHWDQQSLVVGIGRSLHVFAKAD